MYTQKTSAGMDIRELIDVALAGLQRMQLDSQLFCLEARRNDGPRGRSLRYSLMVYLGLLRAERAGYDHGFDLGGMWKALVAEVDHESVTLGDLGLYLWADALTDGAGCDDLVARLSGRLDTEGGLARCVGMELAWIVNGIALQGDRAGARGDRLLRAGLELLVELNGSASGLFYHSGTAGLRRRFPNFATQIYSILALATVTGLQLDERALSVATRAADRVLAHQRPDGGWPWLFDADRGIVVEPYEIYSVHQHAMAPMGFLALAEVSGENRYAAAAAHGLGWVDGHNDLARDMVDRQTPMIFRSIRRRPPASRVYLYANVAAALILGRPLSAGPAALELNATCRPYELGWLLEAWCGREEMADRSDSP